MHDTSRRLIAESLGTAMLLVAIVGSGIMAEKLAGGSLGLALLANSVATGLALSVLILIFGPVSGAYLNPAVTLVSALRGQTSPGLAASYMGVQLAGAVLGVWWTHFMFNLPIVEVATTERAGFGQWAGEFTSTFMLLATIIATTRNSEHATPYAVGAVVTAGFWATSSTSFANPAVTVARALTDTFDGIRPGNVGGFVAAELAGATAALAVMALLKPSAVETPVPIDTPLPDNPSPSSR